MSFISGLQIADRAAHAGQVRVILFGNLDAVPLAQLHDDVQEVHAVEFQLLAERHVVLQIAEIFVGRDVRQDVEDLFSNLGRRHTACSPHKPSRQIV